MKRIAVLVAALSLLATPVFAGMGGGPGGNGMPGRPGSPMGPVAGMSAAPGMSLTVADNGTVLTMKRVPGDPAIPGSGTLEIVAISPAGVELWTWEAPGPVHELEVSGRVVLVSTMDVDLVGTPGAPGSGQQADSVLYALGLASGAEHWKLEIDGRVMNLETSDDMIYAIVGSHDLVEGSGVVPRGGGQGPGTGVGTGELSLYGISYRGVVNWTVNLN